MNIRHPSGEPRSVDDRPLEERSFENLTHEREWQAQERARQAERDRRDDIATDALAQRYRFIARVLREPDPDTLPADFAQLVARRAEAHSAATEPFLAASDRALLGVPITLFVVGCIIVVMLFSAQILPALSDALLRLGAPLHNPWILALTACLAVSTALQRWRPFEPRR